MCSTDIQTICCKLNMQQKRQKKKKFVALPRYGVLLGKNIEFAQQKKRIKQEDSPKKKSGYGGTLKLKDPTEP